MDFVDLRTKASEQATVREEAFRGFLKGFREHQQAEVEEINNLIKKAGEQNREDAKAVMEEQVDLAIQKVKTAVEKAYIEEHEISGMDEYTRRRYKKMLSGLID